MKFTPLDQEEAPAKATFTPLTFTPLEETKAKPPEQFASQVAEPVADNIDPTTGKPYPEARALPEKTFWEKLMGSSEEQTQVEKARASNEAMARRIAAERGVPVSQIYKEAGGARPVFNPEGRETKPAVIDAAAAATKSLTRTKEVDLPLFGKTATPEVILSAANTALRSFRGGDIPVKNKSWLDEAITGSKLEPKKGDANVAAFDNVGQNLGYSLTTMVSSAITGALTSMFAGPVAGVSAGMATSGTVSYRASKDEFLSRIKEKLDKESEKVFERPLDAKEWEKAKQEFDSVATKYAAWEAIPEAVSNAIMLKAFTAPLKAINSADKLFKTTVRATVSQASEQVSETITGAGQNAAELRAGLTKEELSLSDAFRQQFAATLITTGIMQGGAKSVQYANQFYENYVEPKVRPDSALAKAIKADLEAYAAQPPAQQVRPGEVPTEYRPGVAVAPLPTAEELGVTKTKRPKLTELEAARKPELEGEAAAAPLTELEGARKPELEVAQPTGPLVQLEGARKEELEVAQPTGPLAQLEGARKEEIEQEPPVKVEDPRIATQAAYYTAQGFAKDDALLLAIQDIETATGEKIGQPTGRAMQRGDAADEQRTAEGKAERAALSMEETNVPTEIPANVTESIPDQFSNEVPSRDERTASRAEDPFTRGLDSATNLARQSAGREERERTSLEANQKRIQSQISQAFNRESYPDLGPILGTDWTRKILATNPTPEEYQDAAYARLEELGGEAVRQAPPTKETPRVVEAPKAVEAKKERPQAPAAAPSIKEKIFDTQRTKPEAKPGDAIRFNLPWVPGGYEVSGIVGNSVFLDKDGREVTADTAGAKRYANVTYKVDGEQITNPIEVDDLRLNTIRFEEKPDLLTAKPTKPAAEPAPLEMQRTRKEKLETETPIPAQPATAVTGFAPLELEAARKEELEVEPPAVTAVTKTEAALPKEPKTRKPGGGRKKSELAKTQEQRTKDTNAINQFNRDVITLMGAARKFQQPTGQYPTEKEYDYAEAARLRSLDLMRKKLYALSLVRDPKAGYIAAKNYIRGLKPGELARAKGLHEGTVELTKLPPKPKATLTPTQLEKFRKGETETMKPRGRPKKAAAAVIEPVPPFGKQGFLPVVRGGEELMTPEEYDEYLEPKPVYEEPIKSARDYALELAKEAGISEKDLKAATDTIKDMSEDELNFDDVQKMSVSELTRLTQIAATIVETEHSRDADLTFTKLNTLSGALQYIVKTGTPLDAGIADALLSGENGKLIAKVKLFTANPNTKYSTPAASKFWHKELLGAKGLYTPTNNWKGGSVLLAEPGYGHQGINNTTILHEATHAATVMKIAYVETMVDAGKADELSPKLVDGYRELSKLMDRTAYAYEEQVRRGFSSPEIESLIDAEVFTDIKEFAAYGLTEPAMKALLHATPGVNTKRTGFSNFISSLLKILNVNPRYESGLKDFILATGKLMEVKTPSAKKMNELWASRNLNKPLFSAMKKAKTQESETKRVMENLAAAEAGSKKLGVLGDAIAVARDPKIAGDILQAGWDNMSIPALQAWLLTMPTDVIVSVGTDAGIGSMKQAYKDIREVGAFRRRESTRVEDIAKPWIKLNTKERNKLADVMLASTDLQVDPSKDQSNPALNKMWNALTPEAKTIYTKARDYYSNAFKLFNALAMQRIEQSGLKGSIDDPTTPKGRVAQAIKDTYKAGMSIEPYFPLMREGQYWVSFGKKGNYEIQTFPTPGARTRFIRERIRENTAKGDSRTFEQLMLAEQADLGNDIKELQEKASAASPMLKKLFDSVDQMEASAMDDMGKDGLKADIFQMHLMSLPEGTFRKQFIRRKNTKGYGRDALRNFVVSGSRIGGQLARAKYAPKIDNGISAAKASIKGMPNKDRLGMFIRELELRGKDMVNPPNEEGFFSAAVRFANKFIFAYTTTSIKTAVNNTFSFATNAVPTMAKYYGMDATLVEMGKFAGTAAVQVGVTKVKPDGSVVFTWPSLGSSRVVRNSPDLQKAVRRMEELDIVKQNQTFDVYIAKKGAAASKAGLAFDAFVRFTGMPFQGTERIVRETTFLSAFKLGRKQGLDFEAAIDKATMVTDEALFNYDPENMPRAMRNPGVKVLSTLKRFSYFTSIYHLRNAAQMIKPLKGETRRGAAYALFGSMGMTGLVGAGIYQAFGVSTAVGLFGMLQGLWNMINGDDEDDREDGLLKDLNFQRWFNSVYLPENYGDVEFAGVKLSDVLAKGLLTAASGYDFSSGLSQGSLWFKDSPGASGADNAYMNFVESIGFPILSVPANITSGIKDIQEGDTLKGWEKLNPSALTRNPAVAYRYNQEGVLTGMLDTVKYADEFTSMQLFMQGLGYKSAGLAETMDMNFVIKREMARVENVKQDLLKRYYKAEKRGDEDLLDKVDDQIDKFNAMYPSKQLTISGSDIGQYIRGQDKAQKKAERGLTIEKKFQDFDVLRDKGLEQMDEEAE
jgi:hypothetical protein